MGRKGIETLVGFFVLLGLLALVFLAFRAANLGSFDGGSTYTVTAKFQNIGGLKPRAPVRSAGSWNEGRIVIQGGRVQHWLNGQKLVDVPCEGAEWDAMVAGSKFRSWPFGRAKKGRIALQDHGDAVAFRSIRIKPL